MLTNERNSRIVTPCQWGRAMLIVDRLIRSVTFAAGFAAVLCGTAHADTGVKPKIVMQTAVQGIEVAAWTPDDRYVVTGLGIVGRTITIWDAATGIIIDTARLPSGSGEKGSDYIRLTGIDIAPDGRTALVHAIGADVSRADAAFSLEYSVDLATRAVRIMPPRPLAASVKGISGVIETTGALEVIGEGGTDMTPEAAQKILPALPRSHDGRYGLKRSKAGLSIVEGTRIVRTLTVAKALGYADAALAPDGRRLALVTESEGDADAYKTTLEWFDLTTSAYSASVRLDGDYGEISWLNAGTVVTSYETDGDERDATDGSADGPPDPVLVIDAATARTVRTIAPRCYVRALPDGRFVGAGLANCRTKVPPDRALTIYDTARKTWQPLAVPALGDRWIDGISIAPDGTEIVLIVKAKDETPGVLVLDRTSLKMIDELSFPTTKGIVSNVRFAPDGKTLIVAVNGGLHLWKPAEAASRPMSVIAVLPQMIVTDGTMLAVSGGADDAITRVDLASGKRLAPLAFGNAVAGGFVPGKPLFWAASYFGGVRLWDTRTWTELLTTYHFDGRKFLAVTPDGIYDTNLGPDAQQFRWIVPDAPFQSLAPQTFMRDYFEPRLTQRLLDCTIAATCPQVFKPLPPIAALNRVLPQVRITGVKQGDNPKTAIVTVQVAEGIDPQARNGKTHSGVYAVRLFRNDRLVLQQPQLMTETGSTDLTGWRKLNLVPQATGTNTVDLNFTVDMPTAPGTDASEFSAYAFNEDRVKSDTVRMPFRRAATDMRPRRAFVVTIGIDAYDEPRLALRFAAGDAKLVGDRLAAIPGYEVHRIVLAGERTPDGKARRVTRDIVDLVLSVLGGADPKVSVQALTEAGFDASALDIATPDDIVILSFSGHGWADPQGNFYIVPTDGKWPAGAAVPDTSSLISAASLTLYFTAIRAGEIALVIDACHSGASVDANGFKPGPMGDAGLGQLAFDKGLRILAASQASDVALEDPVLRQGLLTYALAGEGITATGGKADENKDGRITIDEWLRYAVGRLPSLSEDTRLGHFASTGASSGSRDFDLLDETPAVRPKPQEPALFDFTGVPSPVVLRSLRP